LKLLGRPRSVKCRSKCRFAEWRLKYFVAEEHELAKDCEGLEVLAESPEEVANQGAVEVRVEEDRQHEGKGDEVV
jgi:hypothetical protein